MINWRIFEARTFYQHWEHRSKEMIDQRLRWWMQALWPALRTADESPWWAMRVSTAARRVGTTTSPSPPIEPMARID